MKTFTLHTLVFSAVILMLPQARLVTAQTVTYNPTTVFSITNGNPNGVWSYGWMSAGFGTLHLLTNTVNGPNPVWAGWGYGGDTTPCIWKNNGPVNVGIPTGWLSLHPGPAQEPIVLRWTAPISSVVHLDGQFFPGDFGTMKVAVRLNGQPWWSASDSGTFLLQTNVAAGATIDFTVYNGYAFGNTPLTVIISTDPQDLLHITRIGTTNIVSFAAPDNGTYTLQFAKTLAPPVQWVGLTTNILSANQILTFYEVQTSQAGFYRTRRD